MNNYDTIIIGGGFAGLSCAKLISDKNKKVLLLETENKVGGELLFYDEILYLNEKTSGTKIIKDITKEINTNFCEIQLDSFVSKISNNKHVEYFSPSGYKTCNASNIIIASGSTENTATHIKLPGRRLKGIYTVGNAMRFLKEDDILVGKDVFILGTHKYGLELARQMQNKKANIIGIATNKDINEKIDYLHTKIYDDYLIKDVNGADVLENIDIENKEKTNCEKINLDTLIINVGSEPTTTLFRDLGLDINEKTKTVDVNEDFETNIKGIYAIGESIKVDEDLKTLISNVNKLSNNI